ncbi:MAG: hypothetical protein U0T75_13595 [Chitinophagales bacterium]
MRILSFLFFIALGTGLRAQELNSWWAEKGIQVDGYAWDWPAQFRYYDGATQIQFSIANDTGAVYVCLKLNEEAAQLRFFRGGFNMWFDPKGKKSETCGIGFPLKHSRKAGEGKKKGAENDNQAETPRPDITHLRLFIAQQQTTLESIRLNGIPNQILALKNEYGVEAAFAWDSLNSLCVEYRIPVRSVLQHAMQVGDTSKPLGFGMVVGAVEMGEHKEKSDDNDSNTGWSNNGGMGGGVMNSGNPYNNNGMYGNNGMNNGLGAPAGGYNNGYGSYNGGSTGFIPMAQEQRIWSKLKLTWQR